MEPNISPTGQRPSKQTPSEPLPMEVGEIEGDAEPRRRAVSPDPEREMVLARRKHGIDMNNKNFKARQKTLLEAAQLKHGSKGDLVQEILECYGIIPLDEDTYKKLEFSRLHQAAWEDLEEVIPTLLKIPGEDVNARDHKGQSPLHTAAFRGHAKVVEHLLKCKGIIITETSETAFTPLHLAADVGHLQVVKMLIEAVRVREGDISLNAFVNSIDSELGRTALHYACRNGNVKVVEELLKCEDIKIEVKDIFDYTPALLAVVANGDHQEVVECFLSLEDLEGRPFKSLTGQMDYEVSEPQQDLGVLYGEKDWRLMFGWPKLIDSYFMDTYFFCILPAQVRKYFQKDWILPAEDRQFFSAMRLAVQGNNGKVLACLLNHIHYFGDAKDVFLSQSYYSNSTNIKNLINELMHYATRIGSVEALKVLLHLEEDDILKYIQCKLDINSTINDETAAFVAVKSLYLFAHVKVNKEDEKYNLRLWTNILSAVNEFCCMKDFNSINRDTKDYTLLYYIWESLDVLPKSMENLQKKTGGCA